MSKENQIIMKFLEFTKNKSNVEIILVNNKEVYINTFGINEKIKSRMLSDLSKKLTKIPESQWKDMINFYLMGYNPLMNPQDYQD